MADRITIAIDHPAWTNRLPGCVEDAHTWSNAVLARIAPGLDGVEIGVTLTDGQAIQVLNERYRGSDTATNVLSFPAFSLSPGTLPPPDAPRPLLLGDVVLALDVLESEVAQAHGSAPGQLNAHLAHLIIHGLLHLFGYDHQSETDAQKMEAVETDLMIVLGFSDPYQDDECIGAPLAAHGAEL